MAADDGFDNDQDFFDEQPPKPGMSTGIKILIGVIVGGGFLGLLCCGGGIWWANRAAESFQLKESAEDVRAITEGIVKIEIPEQFAPQAALNFEMVVKMAVAVYGDESNQSGLMIMEFKQPGGQPQANQGPMIEQQLQQVETMYEQQSLGRFFSREGLESSEMETRELTVRGNPVEFEFSKGIGTLSETELQQIEGTFETKSGAIRIFVQVPAEDYDEEALVKMIESIE